MDARIQRWAKAIWQAEIEAGNCTTPAPLTPILNNKLIAAASAAVAVMDAEEELLPGDLQLEWGKRLGKAA